MNDNARPTLPTGALVRTGLLALYFLALTWVCFRRWAPDVLFGDDLANYGFYLKGWFFRDLPQALFGGFEDKYRPVNSLILSGLFHLFGSDVRPSRWLDMGVNVVCGLLVERIAFALSGRRFAVSVLAATMTVTSRFVLWQATTVTGVLEGGGYVLFLTMMAAVVALYVGLREERGHAVGLTVLAVVAEWLLVFDHERYLSVAPWLAVMLWLAPPRRGTSLLIRSWPPVAVLASVAVNIGYKALLLRQAFMVGTGGNKITLDVPGEIDRTGQALLSIFAFNHGPAYLSGQDLLAPPYGWITFAAGVFLAIFVVLLVVGLVERARDIGADETGSRSLVLPAALVVLAALILVPPILTIHVEQRWLVEPFALLVLVGAWAAGRIADSNRSIRLFLVWTAASLAVDYGVSLGFENLFFVSGARAAESVKHDVIDRLPPGQGATLVASQDVCHWALWDGTFFQVYAPGRGPFVCVGDLKQIDPAVLASPSPPEIYRVVPGRTAQDLSGLIYGDRAYAAETRRVEFMSQFDQGKINDPRPMDSPSGKGVTRLKLDFGDQRRDGMAVITGFSYRFDHVPIRPGDRLEFEAAMAFPTTGPALARVTVTGADGKAVDVYSNQLPFRTRPGPPSTIAVSVPIDRFGPEASVTFSAETPAGVDPTAQWVVYLRPRIAASNAPP